MNTKNSEIPRRLLLVAAAAALGAVACKGRGDAPSSPGTEEAVALTGAGATFPYPLYSKWIAEYEKAKPHVKINYQSIGSGGGIRQVIAGTVDFGATDVPMSAEEARGAKVPLHHVPTTLGAVALAYNVEGVGELKLSPDTVAAIYLGEVEDWNDPRIAASNPGVTLPTKAITVVFRSDGSGTTGVFTEYLAKVSPGWKERVGVGKSVTWPTGVGAKGNEGVTGIVKTTPGAFGYLEVAYARQTRLATVALQNAAGEYVQPEAKSVTAAAAGTVLGDELHASITNSDAKGAYPISAYTYLLLPAEMKDAAKAKAMAEFLWWAATDGQKLAEPLGYAPLPGPVTEKVKHKLRTLRANGRAVLSGA